MARYVNRLHTPVDPRSFSNVISDFMTAEGFALIDYKGVQTWKKGSGWVAAPQYMSISYGPDYVHIEAFIRYAVLPGVYVGEMGIEGFFGWAVKEMLKTRIRKVEGYIVGLWAQQANPNVPPPPSQQIPPQAPPQN